MLTFNPGALFKTQIKELYGTDQNVPENYNPQFQDLLNNTGLLHNRLTVLEGQNPGSRLTALEGQVSTLSGQMGLVQSELFSLDQRLDTYDSLNIAPRLANLESFLRFYSSSETPPISAGPGTLWLKEPLVLMKLGNLSGSTALWRSITGYSFGLSFKDFLLNNENSYRDVVMPSSVAGLTVLRGIPSGVMLTAGRSGNAPVYIAVYWNVPPNAVLGSYGNPTAGTAIWSWEPNEDQVAATTLHNVAPLLPGERLWIKLGLAGPGGPSGDAWCSAFTHMYLDLRQG